MPAAFFCCGGESNVSLIRVGLNFARAIDFYLCRFAMFLISQQFERGVWRRGVCRLLVIALAAGIAPCLPGFAAAVGFVSNVPAIWSRVYDYAWFVSFAIALLTHTLLTLLFYPRFRSA